MSISRRSMLALSGGAAAALIGLRAMPASADAASTMKAMMDFAGAEPTMGGGLKLDTPEIAENGNTVPVSVSFDSPMTEDDHVQSIAIYAEGNPSPGVVVFNFTPLSGQAAATTRVRLAKTQNVIAVAKTSKGEVFMDKREVKVTIGGCGG